MVKTRQASHCLELFFQKCHWCCYVEGELFGEVRGIGGGNTLGGHSNSPNERRECLAEAVVLGMEKMKLRILVPKIFRVEMQCS